MLVWEGMGHWELGMGDRYWGFGVGCDRAWERFDITRRLKPRLYKRSPPSRTKR
ncbi:MULTISPECIES: hypothetical protein [unclassified Microcoleus]|uniref:hypothetical protein n=1 Tax=unclassified Microcoleus TaxID=2642155 RepID=UPI001DF8A4B9|nr:MULTISPECIES: hypothetical protein [unclassified Microcoleus]MCC3568081.1 hypothetical protein [Microcoleus sp. PH2017_31_RDM_U_A]